MSPDVKRLKTELETLWMAMQMDLEEHEPDLSRSQRRQLARSQFVQLVDDVVREVSSS